MLLKFIFIIYFPIICSTLKVCFSPEKNDANPNLTNVATDVKSLFSKEIDSKSIEVIPLYECCNVGKSICLIRDPCLTTSNGTGEALTYSYLAFLRGTQIKQKPYMVYSSTKVFNPDSEFVLKFNESTSFTNHVLISVEAAQGGDLKIVGFYLKTSLDCGYFSRLGKEGRTKLMVSILVSAISIIVVFIFYAIFFRYTYLIDSKTIDIDPAESEKIIETVETPKPEEL